MSWLKKKTTTKHFPSLLPPKNCPNGLLSRKEDVIGMEMKEKSSTANPSFNLNQVLSTLEEWQKKNSTVRKIIAVFFLFFFPQCGFSRLLNIWIFPFTAFCHSISVFLLFSFSDQKCFFFFSYKVLRILLRQTVFLVEAMVCGYLKQDQMESWKTTWTYWEDQVAQEIPESQTMMWCRAHLELSSHHTVSVLFMVPLQ